MNNEPVSWSSIQSGVRTGDVVLFSRPSDSGSRELMQVTDSPFSHVAMLVRPDLSNPAMLWQEATESPAPDPHHHDQPHPGAQLGDAAAVLKVMNSSPYSMIAYYRPLALVRDADFEQRVHLAIDAFDGVPFPSEWAMVEHAALGRLLGWDSGVKSMFCAQLVAATYQRAGLLSTEHPPNWYNQASFGDVGKYAADCHLLLGASWGGPTQMIAL